MENSILSSIKHIKLISKKNPTKDRLLIYLTKLGNEIDMEVLSVTLNKMENDGKLGNHNEEGKEDWYFINIDFNASTVTNAIPDIDAPNIAAMDNNIEIEMQELRAEVTNGCWQAKL